MIRRRPRPADSLDLPEDGSPVYFRWNRDRRSWSACSARSLRPGDFIQTARRDSGGTMRASRVQRVARVVRRLFRRREVIVRPASSGEPGAPVWTLS